MNYAEFKDLRRQEINKALARFAKGTKNALVVGRNNVADLKNHYHSNQERHNKAN